MKSVRDYLTLFEKNVLSNTELYNHFEFLNKNKTTMNYIDLKIWEKKAESFYFTEKNVHNLEKLKNTNQYKTEFITSLGVYNKEYKLDLDLWKKLNLTYENFYQLCIITLINGWRNIFNDEEINENYYLSYNNFEINLCRNFKLNSEIAIRMLKDSKEDKEVLEIENIIYDTKKINKIIITFITILEKIDFINIDLKRIEVKHKKYTFQDIKVINLNEMLYDEILQLTMVQNIRPPLVIEPQNYRLDNNFYIGGYPFVNETSYFLSEKVKNLIIEKDDLYLRITQEYLDNINYLQNIPLKINEIKLNKFLNLSVEHFNALFNIRMDSVFAEFLLNEDDNELIKFQIINKTKIHLNDKIQVYTIMNMLYLCKTFSNLKIYLTWTCEGRGRLICNNSPLSFYSTKCFRDFFEFYNFSNIDSIDATSSAFQIIGGFVKDEKIMQLTNIIANDSKQDLYEYISLKIQTELNYEKIEKIYNNLRTKWTWKHIFVSQLRTTESFITYVKTFDRKVWKIYIMTWAYNKSKDALKESLIQDHLKLSHVAKEYKKEVNEIANIFINTFLKIIKREFSSIYFGKKFVELYAYYYSIKNRTIMFRINEDTHFSYQSYRLQESVKIYTRRFNKKVEDKIQNLLLEKFGKTEKQSIGFKYISSIYKKQMSDKIFTKKTQIATLPNCVHYTDSILLMHVLSECRKKQIPLIPVHDCFYSTTNNLDDIRKFYIDGYIKNVINNSVFTNFLKDIKDRIKKYSNREFINLSFIDKILIIESLVLDLIDNDLVIKIKENIKTNILLILNQIYDKQEKAQLYNLLLKYNLITEINNDSIIIKESLLILNIRSLLKLLIINLKIQSDVNNARLKEQIQTSKFILC